MVAINEVLGYRYRYYDGFSDNYGFTGIAVALCLGAQAVCIGRPYMWGLGAFGQPGVERVLELLRIELYAIMQQLGAPSIKQLVPAMVRRANAPSY